MPRNPLADKVAVLGNLWRSYLNEWGAAARARSSISEKVYCCL
jgi:hypothetical protein